MSTTTSSGAGATPAEVAPPYAVRYVGLATRVLSFVIDAALITVVAIILGVGAALIQGVLHLPAHAQNIIQAIGAAAYIVATVIYFVGFWAATGQTPGARVMRIRVVTSGFTTLTPRRGLLRCGLLRRHGLLRRPLLLLYSR